MEGTPVTIPVDEAKRLAAAEIRLEVAKEEDAYRFAEGVYACFLQSSIDKMDPPHLRPSKDIQVQRLAKRVQPTISQPGMHWIKAVHVSTNTIIGAAAWAGPDLPVHNIFRRSAIKFYGWQEKLGWSDADIDEMYAHVDDEAWSGGHARNDELRNSVMNSEPHWYLASLFTWPEWQGRGVAKRLLDWATLQADAEQPPTPIYLEASAMSKAVYVHVGFVQQGEKNYVRRGPRVVEAVGEKEQGHVESKAGKIEVEVVANKLEADMAH
ncbi:hypothetical protein C7974DRAFT_235789 [Boeremia exigua]|uniref:uncharacterized protein n=1 Tax=Boeremia exigua TaxID=749465 RepID=UPI001E8E9650|nr:uncharacterized protein C7974DRAFT_235789 [Boeremia exigua]KAH6620530.1 hypothetical protein C7974DRAFT_235789 [Boeremia exigua]